MADTELLAQWTVARNCYARQELDFSRFAPARILCRSASYSACLRLASRRVPCAACELAAAGSGERRGQESGDPVELCEAHRRSGFVSLCRASGPDHAACRRSGEQCARFLRALDLDEDRVAQVLGTVAVPAAPLSCPVVPLCAVYECLLRAIGPWKRTASHCRPALAESTPCSPPPDLVIFDPVYAAVLTAVDRDAPARQRRIDFGVRWCSCPGRPQDLACRLYPHSATLHELDEPDAPDEKQTLPATSAEHKATPTRTLWETPPRPAPKKRCPAVAPLLPTPVPPRPRHPGRAFRPHCLVWMCDYAGRVCIDLAAWSRLEGSIEGPLDPETHAHLEQLEQVYWRQ